VQEDHHVHADTLEFSSIQTPSKESTPIVSHALPSSSERNLRKKVQAVMVA
jgi:hypothetical protein